VGHAARTRKRLVYAGVEHAQAGLLAQLGEVRPDKPVRAVRNMHQLRANAMGPS
jgi:hypothetical protein